MVAILRYVLFVSMLVLAGCGDPISAQYERDRLQNAINDAGASGCPEGFEYIPSAGAPWYIEPSPGECVKK